MLQYTVPGMTHESSEEVIGVLDERLVSVLDLSLTLKHIHWNVVGRDFIAVHLMLDDQVEAVRGMVDVLAERIATLGGSPAGTPGRLVERRPWEDYRLGRALVREHLVALEEVYTSIVENHRQAERRLTEIDPVSGNVLVSQLETLEKFQWFVRAHLENARGEVERELEDAMAR